MPRYKVTVCKRFTTRIVELREITVEVEAPNDNKAAVSGLKKLPRDPALWGLVETEDYTELPSDEPAEVVEVEEISKDEEDSHDR